MGDRVRRASGCDGCARQSMLHEVAVKVVRDLLQHQVPPEHDAREEGSWRVLLGGRGVGTVQGEEKAVEGAGQV